MSDEQISLLENYLLEPDREKFFASLVKNSDIYLTLKFLDHLNRYGLEVPAESKPELAKYLASKTFPQGEFSYVHFKHSLLKIESEKDEATRKKLIAQFNEFYLKQHFSFAKPSEVKHVGLLSTNIDKKRPNKLDESVFDVKTVIDKFYTSRNWQDIQNFDPILITKLDLNKLLDKNISCFEQALNYFVDFSHVETDSLVKVLVKYSKMKTKLNKSEYYLEEYILDKMSLEDLQSFKNAHKTIIIDKIFFKALFQKTFDKEFQIVQNQVDVSLEDYKAILVKFKTWTENYQKDEPDLYWFKELISQFLREIIEVDIKLNKLSQETFIQYLEHPLFKHKAYTRKYIYKDPFWNSVHGIPTNEWDTEIDVVNTYLTSFFKEMSNTGEFEKYFEKKFLSKLFYKTKIHAGENIDNIMSIFSGDELSQMRESKDLKFVPWNKKKFNFGESIDLSLEIKNIPNLVVNIFEINTSSYYQKNKVEINEHINLVGLIPSLTKEFSIDSKPIVRQVMDYKDLFPSKRGVFVVEFVGGGLSSRVLIKIGALSLIRQVLSKGYLFHMVDDSKKVCKGPGTTLFLNGKTIKPDEKLDHGFLVPSSESDISEKAILTHDGYSELYDLKIHRESMKFNFWLGFNEEAIVMQQPVSFTVSLSLFVNDQFISPSVLKNVKGEITSTNDVGIKNTVSLDNLKVENGNTSFVYTPQSKVETISVEITGKVFSMAQEKEISVSQTQKININRQRSSKIYSNLYLSQEGEEYCLNYLGKNGEPYANNMVELGFESNIFNSQKKQELETDSEGKIHLGTMKNIKSLKMLRMDSPCSEKLPFSCNIRVDNKIEVLPSSMDIALGEDVCLPFAGKTYEASNYKLLEVRRTAHHSIVKDCKSSITFEDGMIYLNKLPEGSYIFQYINENKTINITIHEGKRWDVTSMYLVKKSSIISLLNQSLYLTYKNLKIEGNKISFQVLSNNPESVSVHAMAYSYFPMNIDTTIALLDGSRVVENSQKYDIQSTENIYLSEKSLSSEVKYVLERKRKTNFMGNTLDKPSCLLKRHMVKETTQDDQNLVSETPYKKSSKQKVKRQKLDAHYNHVSNFTKQYSINNLNTFLEQPGWSLFNIPATPQTESSGPLEFSFDLPVSGPFGSLVFIIKDSRNSLVETLPLPSRPLNPADSTLQESKTANKVYLYERVAHKMENGQQITIKDVAATEMNPLQDLATLFKMLKLDLPSNKDIEEWVFLTNWTSLSPEEQLKKYDKYMSHEMNLFAYFKDQGFFNDVVKPHIENKSSKSLVDWFLLDNQKELEHWLHPAKLSSLNALEQCLLIKYFAKIAPGTAQAIATNIQKKVDIKYHDITEFKRLFDSVLKAKATPSTEEAAAIPGFGGSNAAFGNQQPQMMQQALSNFSQAPVQQQAFGGFGGRGGGTFGGPPQIQQQAMNNLAPPPMMSNLAMPMQQQSFGMRNNAFSNNIRRPINLRRNRRNDYNRIGFSGEEENDDEDYSDEECEEFEEQRAMNQEDDLFCDDYQENIAFDSNHYEQELQTMVNKGIDSQKYRTIGTTHEYVERQYFFDGFSGENKFWRDYSEHILTNPDKPFLSENFIYIGKCKKSIILALALIDLPFEKKTLETEPNNNELTIKSQSNSIIFSKEIQEKGTDKLDLEILISQRFCDPAEKYIPSSDGRTKVLKNIDEFLVGTLYSSRIAVTNTSETFQEINVVTEVPQGSIPVLSLEYMKSTNVGVDSLSTKIIEIFFYFPKEGEFSCYPASINKDGYLVTSAPKIPNLKVVKIFKPKEMKTMNQILSLGTQEDILNFMEKENLHNSSLFKFASIYWLLNDEDFYKKVVALLKKKMIFQETVWSFSMKHGDYEIFLEYLKHKLSSKAFSSVFYLKTDQLTEDSLEYKEYSPLINARVHDIGEYKHKLLNKEFKVTYFQFLIYLSQKTFLSAKDYIYFCSYLVMQDRIDECLIIFAHIKPEEVQGEMKIQFDYLVAFLDLYQDYPKFTKAREICTEYLNYPIFTWRNKFIDLINQISEFDGETELLEKNAEETAGEKNERQSKSEPHLAVELEGKEISATFKNISDITLKFFKIDLEIVFSEDPFLSAKNKDYSYVIPNKTITESVEKSSAFSTKKLTIPEELQSSNVIVKVSSENLTEDLTYFPATMKIQIVKSFGQVKVFDQETNKPVSNIYIKCFAKKTNNTVVFYKDGYTDLRGTFEYAALNSGDLSELQKFSLLVISEKYGAIIKETEPPKVVAKTEIAAAKIISQNLFACQKMGKKKAMNKYHMV